MSKTKKVLLMCATYVLVIALAVGGTLAYLTDRDSKVNIFTVGDVEIELTEDFTQGAELLPGVDIEKKVAIKNIGDNDAYVWFTYAVPTALVDTGNNASKNAIHFNVPGRYWNGYHTNSKYWADGQTEAVADEDTWLYDASTIQHNVTNVEEGVDYTVVTWMYKGAIIPGETTNIGLEKVYLDTHVDIDPEGNWYWVEDGNVTDLNWNTEENGAPKIYVSAYAIQAKDFADVKAAYAAYNKQWGDKGTEYAVDAVKVSSQESYGDIVALLTEGKSIYATESIDLTDPASGNTKIEIADDVSIYGAKDAVISFNETTIITGEGSITIHSGHIKTNYELCISDNATFVIEGGEHSFGAFSATGNGKIIVNGGTLNCRGTYAGVLGISFAENGTLIVNDGTLNMYQPFNLNANRCDAAYVEINGGNIHLLNDTDKLFAVRNIMDKDRLEGGVLRGSSIKITGGIFTTAYELDDTGDANAFIRNEDGNADTTRVLEFNIYNGEKQYDCAVTGGTFYGSWMRTGETGGDGTEVCENTIAGFVADGYEITGDATNGYVVSAK